MPKDLVIVESPTKARTIGRIIGNKYTAIASLGHVRDLPVSRLGVSITDRFTPEYIVSLDKRQVVAEVKKLAQEASTVYLATDPDREGEAISWHLARAAEIPLPQLRRVVFHEITPSAVKEAFQHPRDIDMDLVNAQQARRILDRLVGYKISPLISKKLRWWGLSAGRVQSAALRMVVEREQAIEAFTPREYWSISAQLLPEGPGGNGAKGNGKRAAFSAQLHSLVGQKGRLSISSEAQSTETTQDLEGASYVVTRVQARDVRSRPAPPFITSTLQQEAWRKLRFPTRKTMLQAQQLYEGVSLGPEGSVGLITYMRTDSTHVAEPALREARGYIREAYGASYVPAQARVYRTKVKAAQEAHEAIRPTSVLRRPESISGFLSRDQLRLYELIWKRFVASQMVDALSEGTTVDIHARGAGSSKEYLFRATGAVLKFPGFRLLYQEGADSPQEDGESQALPKLTDGDPLRCLGLGAAQHFTQPPPRYSEASLVGALEEKGIGRPSTYAAIVSTIQERRYVRREGGRLYPLPLGRVVNDLLTDYFAPVMDLGFTAQMEEELDGIARGEREWQTVLREFYEPFARNLEEATQQMPRTDIPTGEICDLCERPMVLKRNRWGRSFLSCSGFPECRNARPLQAKLGVECPRCGGDLVERHAQKGKRRSTFYGCANYPTCNFTVNQRPLPEPCPECAGMLVRKGRGQTQCLDCGHEGPVPQAEPAKAEA